jgi:hypothetical protein
MVIETVDPVATLTRFIVAVGLAGATVAAARAGIRRSALAHGVPFRQRWTTFEQDLIGGLRVVILRLLLPATAALAVLRAEKVSAFLLLFVLGFLATLALYALFLIAYRLAQATGFAWRAAAAASMGGGNRGLAALVMLAGFGGFSASQQEQSLGAFFALDAGNFIALLTAMPLLIGLIAAPRQAVVKLSDAEDESTGEATGIDLKQAKWDLLPLLVIPVSAVVASLPQKEGIADWFIAAGAQTQEVRGALLLYLPWLWIFLAWPSARQLQYAMSEALALFVARACLVVLLVAVIASYMQTDVRDALWQPSVLAVAVLLLAPVSSFAKLICQQTGAGRQTLDQVGALILSSTVLFVGLLALVALVWAISPR